MFENVDGLTDAGVTGILIAHLEAFGSGELKMAEEVVTKKVLDRLGIDHLNDHQ